MDDIVINVYPHNFEKNGKNYCLFLTEEPIDSNKTEKEIFKHLFKKAEKRGAIHLINIKKYSIEISDYTGNVEFIFDEKENLLQIVKF